jgi:outer membrane lipoprotein-sorting protein
VRTILIITGLLTALSTPPQGPDPTELVRRADRLLRGQTHTGTYRMEVTTPRWTRSLKMRVWTKGTDRSLIRIDEPAQETGTGFLKMGVEVWSYLPGVAKTVKIPPSMMQQSWMGSDFTNDDLVKESSILTDYTQHLVGAETLEGVATWHLRLEPRPEATVVWGRVEVWIQQEGDIIRREVFYDQSGEQVSEMTLDQIKELGGRRIPTRYVMVPSDKEGHRTVLYIDEATFDEPIADSFFSLQNLRRIR